MRVAFYNQMFGLNGKNPFSHFKNHFELHFRRKPHKLYRNTDIDHTIKTIKKSRSDIIGLCEIFEGQESDLCSNLKKLGYDHVHFGDSHTTKRSKIKVKVALASKMPCHKIDTPYMPVLHTTGAGGGFLHCYFPELNLDIIAVHLANQRKLSLRSKQIKFVKKYLKNKTKNLIVMGDFNIRYKKLKKDISHLTLVSGKTKTCATTPLFKWFYNKDLDHILTQGFNCLKTGTLEGRSDHKLIYADLEPIPVQNLG
jgi:endonuclease/exonuclease/phosphatase family metal-dependent hydrolase